MLSEDLLGRVTIVDSSRHPFEVITRGIISVPAVERDTTLFFQGTVDNKLFKEIVLGGSPIIENINYEANFIEGILNSFLASAWVYLTHDLDAVYELSEFTIAVTGMAFTSNPRREYELHRGILTSIDIASFEKGLLRNIAGNFVRELYWLNGRIPPKEEVEEKYDNNVFLHWLASRASLGRVSVVHTLLDAHIVERSEKAREYIISRLERIAPKIIEEQKLLKDFTLQD